jgi:hypothetical protein
MYKFETIISDLQASFQEFWKDLIAETKVDQSTDDLSALELEVTKMYSTTLFEAAVKVLSQQELTDLELLLKADPALNPFDVYFSAASTKPNIDEVVTEELKDAKEQIIFLFKSI